MSLREIAALMRRHFTALLVVLVVAAGVAYVIKRTPPVYQESATAVLTGPGSLAHPNPYSSFNDFLVATALVTTDFLMGPQGQQQIRAAGATADFDVALFNSYNIEYPYYGTPYATVSVVSQDPAQVQATFAVVTRILTQDVTKFQIQQGASPRSLITAHIVGDSGPLVQPGSPKRTFAGIMVLTIVVLLLVLTFLDRHPIRLGTLRRFLRPIPRDPRVRDQPPAPARPGAR